MTKGLIAIPIYISPIVLVGVLYETSVNNAYSPEADSLGIPLFSYLLFFFPITLWIASKIPRGPLAKPKNIWWNRKQDAFSAASLILTIFPIGLFWFGFFLAGISSYSYRSAFLSFMELIVVILARTYAIQQERNV